MCKKIFVFAFVLLASCSQEPKETITVQDAWIREAPPNASAMAGYLSITNSTEQDRILTFAKSKHFNTVEIHRTIVEDGVAKMRRHNELIVPAGDSLVFKPGDFHLMLMSPQSELKAGDEVTITLCLLINDKIEELDVVMPVRKP